ncbi:MAG: histidine phosphatase family protein [Clostridia bacterium]|nr:histidine phosphatase family protein [Clostridia bacterium]
MKIIMIRHGDPDYANDTLTRKGRYEALALARYLKNKHVSEFYCSPMGRARDTAAPTLSATGRKAQILDWLQEFPGYIVDPITLKKRIPWDLIPAQWTQISELYDKDKWLDADIMKTGDVKEVYEYVCRELDEFLAAHGYIREGACYKAVRSNHDTIVFFCHFGIQCVLLSHLLGISPVVLWQGTVCSPTGITALATEEREEGTAYFRCNRFGELTHLYVDGQAPSFAARFRETANDDEGI